MVDIPVFLIFIKPDYWRKRLVPPKRVLFDGNFIAFKEERLVLIAVKKIAPALAAGNSVVVKASGRCEIEYR